MRNDATPHTAEQVASDLGITLDQLRGHIADPDDPIPCFTVEGDFGTHPDGQWSPAAADVVPVLGDTAETPVHARRPADLAALRFRGRDVLTWVKRREAAGEPPPKPRKVLRRRKAA